MMCCKVPYLQEFEKLPGVWCRYAAPGKGCTIYENRPASCQAFYCQWMLDASLGPEWKPDRARFVVYLQRNGVNLQVAVDPGFPQAWTRPPYYRQLKQWAQEGAERGAFVFVRIGERMIAMLPDRDEDIGAVGVDDELVVARRATPAGPAYDVEVRRLSPRGQA
jgi:hypothetical protein